MGTPFKMKGSAFYGKGNQSPVSQIGGLPEKVAPVRPAPSAPAAPSAASLDYVNPVEGSSPVEQVQAKQELGAAGNAAANKAEMYAKRAQGPIEQRSMTPPPGWRAERQAPSVPSAPSAASLDYVNPTEGSSPMEQKKQPETYSGQATSLKSHKNKMQRLTGKTVTYKDAWQGMPAHKRKSKFGDDYNKFVSEAEAWNEANPDYKRGTAKYQRYQGTY